ncbi:hypothetical protein CDD83_7098 [Cordyceps sp. RAO-2017]|nr:hypothetical protein CDD83_7098 [Cordyceps sp. RAO-2017]
MKLYGSLILAALYVGGVASSPAETAAEKECGALGVMSIDSNSLPPGADPNKVRQCAEHPLGPTPNLHRRDCWYGNPSGCSKGYCWRTCGAGGSGQWCWSANNGGTGSWIGCKKDSDCNPSMSCGIGNCKTCGCSC